MTGAPLAPPAPLTPTANRVRGEVGALLDGRPYTLCLTLGALAELETAFGVDDLAGLAARLSSGLSARDVLAILRAGLRGGGHALPDDAIEGMRAEGGAGGLARLCAELLTATFAGADRGTGR